MTQSNPIRVLVADDSFFMRKLIATILEGAPDITVVGQAKDGEEAINLAMELNPDVITMDFNMPKLNGAEATEKIIGSTNHPPIIIMVSAYTIHGADSTLESLRAGAVDFITKPSGELSLDINKVGIELITKIRTLFHEKPRVHPRKSESKPKSTENLNISSNFRPKIVIIGSSTGGPPVVEDIVSKLSPNFSASLIIAQHMPGSFTPNFAKRLNDRSPIDISEGKEGMEVQPGKGIVAPGSTHTHLQKILTTTKIFLSLEPVQNTLYPSIDVIMSSAASIFGPETLGIVLTGMGNDGLLGSKFIKASGGITIAQDLGEAVLASMPRALIETKTADHIMTADQIAYFINKVTTNG